MRRPAGGDGTEERDFLELHFAEAGRIWVPVEQIERVTRYAGGEEPQLVALGGGEWQRARTRVRKAVGDLAKELLELYSRARRAPGPAVRRGHAVAGRDGGRLPVRGDARPAARGRSRSRPTWSATARWTASSSATSATARPRSRSGRRSRPSRRARQVAVLVPTTVLAAQHLVTFRQRFAAYPVTVRMLSRFVPRAEQQDTLAGLAAGAVDLVIGTHRLLSRDIRFRDLGLVVVDEEQRFGVAHKERLKQLQTEVHVLTLSATPIPRTLNLALVGVRDMSVIETPPEDRLPIQTRVAEASAGLVRDAILRELDRGGQVFFVHNRVETIEAQAEQLRRLLPSARIAVAHGQMAEGALETGHARLRRAASTTSSSARRSSSRASTSPTPTRSSSTAPTRSAWPSSTSCAGRVGRSVARAYAYLLYRRRAQLSDVARKRLQAIFNASELGAGFQIALSDLEIRGAGNILGAEQHGHMAAVGFDLYTRMLAEAVEDEKAALEGRPARHRRGRSGHRPARGRLPARRLRARGAPEAGALPAPRTGRERRRAGRDARRARSTATGRCPRRSSGCSRSRGCATAPRPPGSCRSAREEGQLVLRFGPDWSRAATMRALAPRVADRPAAGARGRPPLRLQPAARAICHVTPRPAGSSPASSWTA